MEKERFDYEKWLEEKRKREEEEIRKRERRMRELKIGVISSFAIAFVGFAMMWNFGRRSEKAQSEEIRKYYEVLKPIYSEWEDALDLAEHTPRIQLPSVVDKLQEIKRRIEAIPLPEDYEVASLSGTMLSGMQEVIDGFLNFMGIEESKALTELKDIDASYQITEGEARVISAYSSLLARVTQ